MDQPANPVFPPKRPAGSKPPQVQASVADPKQHALRWFEYAHLPEEMQAISREVYALAEFMYDNLGSGAEKSAGLRKLLEAKDCFVRQARDDLPGTEVR